MIDTDSKNIEYVVTRGVERIFPHEDFLKSRLSSGEQLTIYLGIDPTGPTLHMGHVIPLIKLAQLQTLGHKIILVIGDFTAQIGDPDKSQARTQLTHEQVLENARLYKKQAEMILKFEGDNPAELKYNSKWLGTMNFGDVIHLASHMTVQRMLDRDLFRRRIDAGTPVYIHEFMYPLMQGYDSVVLNVDGEVGGNDQTFNMLVGRDFQKDINDKEKFVIPMKLLVDTTGQKMGKTTGNMLSLLDTAEEKFKKIMRWTDDMIQLGFELLTDVSLESITQRLESQENPRDIKIDLAVAVLSRFHTDDEVAQAKDTWLNDVGNNAQPENIPQIKLLDSFVETLAQATGESKSQVKRLLKDGAVKVNGEKVQEDYHVQLHDTIQVGKKHWFQISE